MRLKVSINYIHHIVMHGASDFRSECFSKISPNMFAHKVTKFQIYKEKFHKSKIN